MQGAICLITGGTSGIGKATAIELARQGATIVLAARTTERGEQVTRDLREQSGSQRVYALPCDLESQDSIRKFAASFERDYGRVDVLVHSGAAVVPRWEMTSDGVERTFATAYLSIFLLCDLLRDLLVASAPARIIIISGELHRRVSLDFEDLMSEKKFSMVTAGSRAALAKIVFANELARRLEGTQVTVNSLHPGAVRTKLLRNLPWYLRALAAPMQRFFASPKQGARTPVFLATSPTLKGVSGKYFIDCQGVEPSREALDLATAETLWTASEALVRPAPSIKS